MAATDNGTMTLTQARQTAAQSVMRLGSFDPTSIPDVIRLDSAIKAAGDEFSMRLFPQRVVWSFTLPPNSKFVSFSDASSAPAWSGTATYAPGDLVKYNGNGYELASMGYSTITPDVDVQNWAPVIAGVPADFSCRRCRSVELVDQTIGRRLLQNLVDTDTIKSYLWRPYGFVYMPNLIIPSAVGSAFFTEGLISFDAENDHMWIYPVYTAPLTVNVRYWEPFVSWTFGMTTPNDVILNIPDTMMSGILYYLVPQFFDMAQASSDYIKTCQVKMKEHYAFCTRALKGSSSQYGMPLIRGTDASAGSF